MTVAPEGCRVTTTALPSAGSRSLRILGHGITSVEQVTGRMTTGRAALYGAIFGAVTQWATRGRRDFRSASTFTAQSYEVLVSSDRFAEARRLLTGRR